MVKSTQTESVEWLSVCKEDREVLGTYREVYKLLTQLSPISPCTVDRMGDTETNSSGLNLNQTKVWESAVPPALQFALGVVANLIALGLLVKSAKYHKWKPFYRLVGGLALTDGGGILLVYPTVMVRYATDFTYDYPETLCNYSSFIFLLLFTSSAMIVCAMSFDRFLQLFIR